MATHTGRLGNVTIKKETAWGTYNAGDLKLRITSEGLERNIEHEEDPALIGALFTTEMIKVGDKASGSIEISAHPDTIGPLFDFALGTNAAVTNPPDSWLVVNYTGSSKYARLTKAANSLTADLSSDGSSWTADSNFGTAGAYDLSSATQDTTAELQALIEADTDWSCAYFGKAAGVTADIADFAATTLVSNSEKQGAVIMPTLVTSTDAKSHKITAAVASSNLPSFSMTTDRTLGTNKSLGFVGSKIGSTTLTLGAKGLVKLSFTISCKAEEVDKNDVVVTVPTQDAFIAAKAQVMIDEIKSNEMKELSITVSSNLDESNVIGSYNIVEQIRQGATIETSFTANLDDVTAGIYSKRSNFINDTPSEIIIYLESTEYADVTNTVPYSVLLRLNKNKFTQFSSPLQGPDRLTISGAATCIQPSTAIAQHIILDVVDGDTATY